MSPSSVLSPVAVAGLVRSFALRAGEHPVLDGLDLVVAPGSRLGLIGENGAGKSTLLRLLAGQDTPDAGTVSVPADVVHLAQEPPATAGTVGDLLAAALRPLRAAVAEVERLAAGLADGSGTDAEGAYDAALAWALAHDAWDADRRTDVVASALGVAQLDARRPVSTLSGGQRTRLALAATLVRRPACLLLDEPTNHLDDQALELLERELGRMPGVVIAASHDRTFLDGVCTELLDLDAGALGTDGQGGHRFGGTFTEYLAHQERSRSRWEQTWATQQAEIERLRAETARGLDAVAPGRGPRDNDKFITKFKGARVERTRARRVHDAERRLEVAEREALDRPPAPLRFSGGLTGPRAASVAVRGLTVGGRLHVERLDVAAGEKVLVTGANGSGKSTLLAVLHGDLAPDAGTVEVSAQRIGLVAQDPDLGPPGRSAAAFYAAAVGNRMADEVPLRSLGLLPPGEERTEVGALSVGQRRRLSLAVAVASGPDLLLLDEPTNHLSLRLVSELEEALAGAPGTVVVTSHDRWLRRRWDGPEVTL